jgi:hypothetical protein
MTPEEINEELLKQLALYKETNVISPTLKELFMELIWRESYNRYIDLDETIKFISESEAYVHCCKNSIYFNPEKAISRNSARAYMINVIRCSFAGAIVKEKKKRLKMKANETR